MYKGFKGCLGESRTR